MLKRAFMDRAVLKNFDPFAAHAMTDGDFIRMSALIKDACGIKLSLMKKGMLASRLGKRLTTLGLKSFRQYLDYLKSPDGQAEELCVMVDLVTTNKTDFFREPAHFGYLGGKAVPELMRGRDPAQGPLRVWSAGCSTGEEPYSIAMALSDYGEINQGFRFSVMATDVSNRALETAKRAVYEERAVTPIPAFYKRKFMMRGKGEWAGCYRVAPEIRQLVVFRRLNLMDDHLDTGGPVDAIFCRNVIIYFDRATQGELMRKFFGALAPGGYLFIGYSETLDGVSEEFARVAPTIYRRPGWNR